MITTVKLVDVYHHSYKTFFLVVRIFQIYSLSNFQIFVIQVL